MRTLDGEQYDNLAEAIVDSFTNASPEAADYADLVGQAKDIIDRNSNEK